MLQVIPDMLNNVHVWEFRWPMEVSKVRRVFLEPIGSISRCADRIFLLEVSKSIGMLNRHEWVQVIEQDAYLPVRVVFKHIKGLI